MTQNEFQAAMLAAKSEDRLLFVADDYSFGIALGYDSAQGIILCHGGVTVGMSDAREIKPL